MKPLAQEPFDVQANPLLGFADNRVNPYIQNFNFEIQRELAKNLTFEARYIGSKGTHLYGGISINDVNIYENGILNAFNITRAGGDAPLFDQMLNGITLNAGTNAALGQGVVNGTTLTGSAALRGNTHLQDVSCQRQCRPVRQRSEHFNDRHRQSRRSAYEERRFPDNFIVANPQYRRPSLATRIPAVPRTIR